MLPVPEPKANEAVVKLVASGVNFIDVYQREGRYKVPLPFVLGQEGAGVVTAVGSDVTSVKAEATAFLDRTFGRVRSNMPRFPPTAWWQSPSESPISRLRQPLLQGMTAHYLCHDTYPLKRGETALVHAAAGGVGLLLVQMAHDIGARVLATVSTERRLNWLVRLAQTKSSFTRI